MAETSEFQLVNESGWRMGFKNLMRREASRRLSARNLLIQSVIWLVLLNFVLAMVIEVEEGVYAVTVTGVQTFTFMAGLLGAIGMVVATQGAIVNEKRSGTAAWVLSKPATRHAFILSKFITIGGGLLAIIIVLQGLVAYFQLSLSQASPLPVLPFIGGMSLLALNLIFYLSLTLMLGTMFQGRIGVLGLPVAFIISQVFLLGLLDKVTAWLPYLFPGALSGLSRVMILESPPPSYWFLPIVTTTVLSALFIYLAIWRFQREEL